VLGGNPGAWTAKEHAFEAEYNNGIEAWVFAFGGDYSCGGTLDPKRLANYDIIIGNTNFPYLENLRSYISEKPQNVKWVSLIEGSMLEYLPPHQVIKDILDGSDLVNVINKHSLDFFKSLTSSRTEYIGIPHPSEAIRKFTTPIEKRRKEIMLCSFPVKRQSDYLAAKGLGVDLLAFEKRISRKLTNLRSQYREYGTFDPEVRMNRAKKYYSGLTIERERPMKEYFEKSGGAMLWMNLDERYTWGRNILDAAALQVPVISTPSTAHTLDLFPELTVPTPFSITEAKELAKRLLEDNDFYKKVSTISLNRLEEFSPSRMKEKLLSCL
jgi:hypothetical protein